MTTDITKHPEFYRVDSLIKDRVRNRPNGPAYHDDPKYWDKVSAESEKRYLLKLYADKIEDIKLEIQINPTEAHHHYYMITVWESIIECLNLYDCELAVR